MTKVNLKDFEKNMKKFFDEFQKPETMRKVWEYAADRIQKRTRLGKGVSQLEGDATPLKPLSSKYVEKRKKSKKKGELSEIATPKKSNLTFTGQMLNALSVLKTSTGRVLIGIKSTKRSDSDNTNDEIAGYVSKERPFLNLSKAEMNGVRSFIRKIISNLLGR